MPYVIVRQRPRNKADAPRLQRAHSKGRRIMEMSAVSQQKTKQTMSTGATHAMWPAPSYSSAKRPTLPLPNELIDQILRRLSLYDRRSFAVCSRANYDIAFGDLFDDVVLGKTVGTVAVANQIFREGRGKSGMERRWGCKLSARSLMMLNRKGHFMGDVEFLMGNCRLMRLIRNLHIGLPSSSTWSLRDPSNPSTCGVDLEKLTVCLSNLPNLRGISLYAPTPFEISQSSGNYEGLDVRLFHHVLSQFNDIYALKELNVTWWPHISRTISDPTVPFYFPDGSQLLPSGLRDRQADDTMDIGLYGPPAAEVIRLNILPGDFPSSSSSKHKVGFGEYTYTPRRTWRDVHAGRTNVEQKTLQSHIPRMLYSLLLPSCIAKTLTTLELAVDTCPCCCLSKSDQSSYLSIAEWEIPDFTFPLPPPLLPMGFYHHSRANITRPPMTGNSEYGFARFNLKDFRTAPLKSFSYRGPRCPRGSWVHYAADTWGSTLEHLSVIEAKIPHAGTERGEGFGRGPEKWDPLTHPLVIMRLDKLRHLCLSYSFQSDERDADWVSQAYQTFDDEGNRHDGEDGLEGTPFEVAGGTVTRSTVVTAVTDAVTLLTAEQEDEAATIGEEGVAATLPILQAYAYDDEVNDDMGVTSSGSSTPPVAVQIATPALPTPLEAARTEFYRAGRKRRIREVKKFAVHMPHLQRVSWAMHGFFLPFDDDSSADDDDPSRDINEIALAETVCFDLLIDHGNEDGDAKLKVVAGGTEGLGGSIVLF